MDQGSRAARNRVQLKFRWVLLFSWVLELGGKSAKRMHLIAGLGVAKGYGIPRNKMRAVKK